MEFCISHFTSRTEEAGRPLVKKETKESDGKLNLHLKEGNTRMKWLQFHSDLLSFTGTERSSLKFCLQVFHSLIFGPVCVLHVADGDAFSGSSPDSTADGASLWHPGAQAGAV